MLPKKKPTSRLHLFYHIYVSFSLGALFFSSLFCAEIVIMMKNVTYMTMFVPICYRVIRQKIM